MRIRRAAIPAILVLGAARSILASPPRPLVRVQVPVFMCMERPPPESTGSLTLGSRKLKNNSRTP